MSDRRLPSGRAAGKMERGFVAAPDRRLRLRRSVLILLVGDGTLRAWLRRGERIEVLGRLPVAASAEGGSADLAGLLERLAGSRRRRSVTVVLRLDANAGLVREDLLPKRAARDLERVLANRIDVLTPWTVEDAVFTCWDLRERDDGRITVSVAVARKARVEAAQAVVRRFGLRPDIVDFVVDAPTAPPRFDLLLPPPRSRLPGLLRGGAVAVLAATVGAGLLMGYELAAVEERIAMRKDRLQEMREELARRIATPAEDDVARSASRTVARIGTERVSPLRLLDALTRLLPDRVWLESLVLRGRDLEIRGMAEDTAELARLFEDSAEFSDPRFVAPVVSAGNDTPEGRPVVRFALALEAGGALLAVNRTSERAGEDGR